jgi:DNA-directed RNA polymerase subunit N (RpoN/RPB10)
VKVISANSLVLPLTCLKQQRVFIMIPIVSLVNLLSKYGFCKSNGYPISKSSWSTWHDSEIIERFNQILISISCHYSGCKNKKYLGYIQYILCFSCGKTLACKHKTTLKSIWHTYADQLARSDFSSEKKNTLNLGFLTRINKMFITHKRIVTWDFTNLYPDPIVLLLINKVYKKTIF